MGNPIKCVRKGAPTFSLNAFSNRRNKAGQLQRIRIDAALLNCAGQLASCGKQRRQRQPLRGNIFESKLVVNQFGQRARKERDDRKLKLFVFYWGLRSNSGRAQRRWHGKSRFRWGRVWRRCTRNISGATIEKRNEQRNATNAFRHHTTESPREFLPGLVAVEQRS